MTIDTSLDFVPINIAVVTISDSRITETDTSGALLEERLTKAGHTLFNRQIIPDNVKLAEVTITKRLSITINL